MPRHSTPRRRSDDTPTAHPYVRISDPIQRKGGGLERQLSADLQSFCQHNGFQVSKKIWVDDGVSGWDGSNLNEELGRFLDEVRRGLIRPGDCLLVENLDRIARHGRRGRRFMDEIQDHGVHVGVLHGGKLYRADSDDLADAILPMLEFNRGQSESDAKSERNKARWQKKRDAARANGETMTHRLSAWIREVDGKRELIPERAATIQRIFALARNGCGLSMIVKKLTEEGAPPFAGKHWSRSYVGEILMDRRVLGELQPRLRNGEPSGEVIKGYYPPVVTEDEWAAARLGATQRKLHRGRLGRNVNPFAGLVKNALGTDSYCLTSRMSAGKLRRVLINVHASEGRAPALTFPYNEFEEAVLKCLREIDPHSILNGDQGPDETTVLAGQLARVEGELDDAKAWMKKRRDEGKSFSATIADQIAELEGKQKELSGKLREARRRATHPLSEVWGEAQDLMSAIETAEDPTSVRLRLRAKLREMIDTIQMLIVVRGRVRLAALQVWFAGGKRRRDYLIYYKPQQCNAKVRIPGGYWCRSLADVAKADDLDLRRREDADALAELLGDIDLSQLQASLESR